jgi:hypothetical protein
MDKIEVQTSDGTWTDLSPSLQPHGRRNGKTSGVAFGDARRAWLDQWGAPRVGLREQRVEAYRLRKALLDSGRSHNITVQAARSATARSELRRASKRYGGRTDLHAPHPATSRLRWHGLTLDVDDAPQGGTARQRAAYRRAVARGL